MATPLTTIKNWFKTGLKPTQAQFWAVFDSFRHKDDAVPAADVSGLQLLLDGKMDKKAITATIKAGTYVPGQAYVYDALVPEYVSFSNPASPNPDFVAEGWYRLTANATGAQTPETNPEIWKYNGRTLGDVTIEDVFGLREELDDIDGRIDALEIPTETETDISQLLDYDPALAYTAGETYRVYVNLESADESFRTKSIYQAMADAAVGQSPETHPFDPETGTGIWWRIGNTVSVSSYVTSRGSVSSLTELMNIANPRHGDTCGIYIDTFGTLEVVLFYDATSMVAHSLYSCIKPASILATDPGRWLFKFVRRLFSVAKGYSLQLTSTTAYIGEGHCYFNALNGRTSILFKMTNNPLLANYVVSQAVIYIDNLVNTSAMAFTLDFTEMPGDVAWLGGVAVTSIAAGKRAKMVIDSFKNGATAVKHYVKYEVVGEGGNIDGFESHIDGADDQKHSTNQIIEQAAHTLLSLPEQSKLNTVIAAIINYLSGTINASSINDPTWQLTEQRLAILQKLESGIAVSGAALLLDIFAPPGVEASLRDNAGWSNEKKTLAGDNSSGALGYKGAHIWLNDAVFAECVDSSPTTAVYKRNRAVDVLDPVSNTQDAAICNALDPSFAYPAMTVTGNSTDAGWNLTSQVKVITGLPCRWGMWFVGGLSGDGYTYHCFYVNGATSYWKRTGMPSSIQLEIYAATHPVLTAHLLSHDFTATAYTPVAGDEAAFVSQTFYDETTRGYYKKMINGNWEKLR